MLYNRIQIQLEWKCQSNFASKQFGNTYIGSSTLWLTADSIGSVPSTGRNRELVLMIFACVWLVADGFWRAQNSPNCWWLSFQIISIPHSLSRRYIILSNWVRVPLCHPIGQCDWLYNITDIFYLYTLNRPFHHGSSGSASALLK